MSVLLEESYRELQDNTEVCSTRCLCFSNIIFLAYVCLCVCVCVCVYVCFKSQQNIWYGTMRPCVFITLTPNESFSLTATRQSARHTHTHTHTHTRTQPPDNLLVKPPLLRPDIWTRRHQGLSRCATNFAKTRLVSARTANGDLCKRRRSYFRALCSTLADLSEAPEQAGPTTQRMYSMSSHLFLRKRRKQNDNLSVMTAVPTMQLSIKTSLLHPLLY